eukprot:1232750-Rhodomonas_salina.1
MRRPRHGHWHHARVYHSRSSYHPVGLHRHHHTPRAEGGSVVGIACTVLHAVDWAADHDGARRRRACQVAVGPGHVAHGIRGSEDQRTIIYQSVSLLGEWYKLAVQSALVQSATIPATASGVCRGVGAYGPMHMMLTCQPVRVKPGVYRVRIPTQKLENRP